mgnify:CR=1 FL=1
MRAELARLYHDLDKLTRYGEIREILQSIMPTSLARETEEDSILQRAAVAGDRYQRLSSSMLESPDLHAIDSDMEVGLFPADIVMAYDAKNRPLVDIRLEERDIRDFGAVFGGNDDTAAVQAAFDDCENGGAIYFPGICTITAPIIPPSIPADEILKIRGLGQWQSGLDAGAAMDYLLEMNNPYMVLEDIGLVGNALATDCLYFNGCGRSRLTGVLAKSAKRSGGYGPTGGANNNNMIFQTCRFDSNGTAINSGTASTTAASTTVTFSVALPASVVQGMWLRVNNGRPHEINTIAGDRLSCAVYQNEECTQNNTGYEIYYGSGLFADRGTDNNTWTIVGGDYRLNKEAGLKSFALYGPNVLGGQFDNNLFAGVILGRRVTNSPVHNPNFTGSYFEANDFADIVCGATRNLKVASPLWTSVDRLFAPDGIGTYGIMVDFKGATYRSGQLNASPYSPGLRKETVLTTTPDMDSWEVGDKIDNSGVVAGGSPGWRTTTAGSQGTFSATITATTTANLRVITLTDSAGTPNFATVYEGAYITIVGVAGIKKIVSVKGSGTTRTVLIDSNCNAGVGPGAVVNYSAAVFKAEANVAA